MIWIIAILATAALLGFVVCFSACVVASKADVAMEKWGDDPLFHVEEDSK